MRETGVPPWGMATTRTMLPATLAQLAAAEATGEGQLAVTVPATRIAKLATLPR